MCGEFWDESIRDSEEARTKTNGVAKRGERDSVRDPEWRSRKQGLEEDAQRRERKRPERRFPGMKLGLKNRIHVHLPKHGVMALCRNKGSSQRGL
ncbi:MAG: hypothetical protein RIR26_2156 [Pseudomonadota bacterium]